MLGGLILQVLLGDMGAGKSSLVIRFVKGQFLEFQVILLIPDLILVVASLVDYTRFQVYCALANMHVDMCATVYSWMIATDHRLFPLPC